MFPAVHFVNTNVTEEKTKCLLSEKKLNELPDNSRNIFKKSILIGTLTEQMHYLVMKSRVL